jgi:hypothetical protein
MLALPLGPTAVHRLADAQDTDVSVVAGPEPEKVDQRAPLSRSIKGRVFPDSAVKEPTAVQAPPGWQDTDTSRPSLARAGRPGRSNDQ